MSFKSLVERTLREKPEIVVNQVQDYLEKNNPVGIDAAVKLHLLDNPVNVSNEIRIGFVVESFPTINQYLVFSIHNRVQHLCSNISDVGSSLFGVRSASTIPNGSIVIYLLDHTNYGYILGTIYQPVKLTHELFGDRITNYALTLGDFPEYKEFLKNSGYHIFGSLHTDSFSHGEFNKFTANGTMFHLDNLMSFFRASENCGVWAFHSDNLLRIIAENYDFWSRGIRKTLRNDPIFSTDTEIVEDGVKSYIRNNVLEVVFEEEIKNLVFSGRKFPVFLGDTDFIDFDSLSKILKISGGISNIEKEIVLSTVKLKNSTRNDQYNLMEINKKSDGFYSVKTARGFILLSVFDKDYLFRKNEIEDPFGDNISNYNLQIPLIRNIGIPESYFSLKNIHPNLPSVHGSGIIDKINFHFNEESKFRFRKHQLDFQSSNPRNLFCSPILSDVCTSSSRKTFYFPKKVNPTIDLDEVVVEEYEELEVNPKPSFYSVLEDGVQIMGNGYGCEIRMEKDTLYIRAPKIHIQSGDELSIWGGNGIYQRSNGEIQIVSTKKDVSVKARKNLQMVGGNFGEVDGLTDKGSVTIISYGDHLVLSNKKNLNSEEGGSENQYSFIDIRKNSIKLYARSTPNQLDNSNNQIKSYIQTDSDELHLAATKIDCEQKDTDLPLEQFVFSSTSEVIFPQPLWHQIYVMHGMTSDLEDWKEYPDPLTSTLPWGTNESDYVYKQNLGYTMDMTVESNFKYGEGSLELNKDKFPIIKKN